MKLQAISLALIAVTTLVGCNGNKQQQAQNAAPIDSTTTHDVTDVAVMPPVSTAAYDPMTVTPTPVQPVSTSYASTATPASSMMVSAGSTYTVRRGDTLFGIARTTYGDGKQWKRIANANPGISPQSLRVGQTLNLPQ